SRSPRLLAASVIAAANSPDAPCGSARKTTSWPRRFPGEVSTKRRSASPRRCGCTEPTAWPAFECAVSAPISTFGCPVTILRISPPAYPLDPATATDTVTRINIHDGGGLRELVFWSRRERWKNTLHDCSHIAQRGRGLRLPRPPRRGPARQ